MAKKKIKSVEQIIETPKNIAFYDDNGKVWGLTQRIITKNDKSYKELTDEEYALAMKYLSDDNYKVVIIDNVLTVVDRYTPEEIAEKNTTIEKERISTFAKSILSSNEFGGDWMLAFDNFDKYSKENQIDILNYRESLREVIRGNLDTLPDIPAWYKK